MKRNIPDSKVHGANMGPIWGRQDPGGPHVGPISFDIWDTQEMFWEMCVFCGLAGATFTHFTNKGYPKPRLDKQLHYIVFAVTDPQFACLAHLCF